MSTRFSKVAINRNAFLTLQKVKRAGSREFVIKNGKKSCLERRQRQLKEWCIHLRVLTRKLKQFGYPLSVFQFFP